MLRRCMLIAASVLLALPLGGCWDSKYLDNLSIVVGIGVDQDPKNEKNLRVTLQTVIPNQVSDSQSGSGKEGIPVINYVGTGETLIDCFLSAHHYAPRRLYFSHNQIMVIGERLARKGVSDIFDLIDRDMEIRTDFDVMVAKNGTAEDVLKTVTSMEKIPTNQIYGMIRTMQQRVGNLYSVKIKDFIESIKSVKNDPAIPSIELIGNADQAQRKSNVDRIEPENMLRMDSMAVFHGGKLMGYLSDEQSIGFSLIKNKLKRMNVFVQVGENEKITVTHLQSKAKMKAIFYRNRPAVLIEVNHQSLIMDNTSRRIQLKDEKEIRWVERQAEKNEQKQILGSLSRLQELNSDAAGFGRCVYQKSPKYWKRNKEKWDSIYPELSIVVQVRTKILGTGVRIRSYIGEERGT